MNNRINNQAEHAEEEITSEEESEIDFSKLTDEEKDAMILEMHASEMMEKSEETPEPKKRKLKRRKKAKQPQGADIAPGFGWVAIKMASAMTFSMVFIFLGPLLIFMALFKAFSDRSIYDWYDLIFGLVGIGLTIASYFLFRYIIKD